MTRTPPTASASGEPQPLHGNFHGRDAHGAEEPSDDLTQRAADHLAAWDPARRPTLCPPGCPTACPLCPELLGHVEELPGAGESGALQPRAAGDEAGPPGPGGHPRSCPSQAQASPP